MSEPMKMTPAKLADWWERNWVRYHDPANGSLEFTEAVSQTMEYLRSKVFTHELKIESKAPAVIDVTWVPKQDQSDFNGTYATTPGAAGIIPEGRGA